METLAIQQKTPKEHIHGIFESGRKETFRWPSAKTKSSVRAAFKLKFNKFESVF